MQKWVIIWRFLIWETRGKRWTKLPFHIHTEEEMKEKKKYLRELILKYSRKRKTGEAAMEILVSDFRLLIKSVYAELEYNQVDWDFLAAGFVSSAILHLIDEYISDIEGGTTGNKHLNTVLKVKLVECCLKEFEAFMEE